MLGLMQAFVEQVAHTGVKGLAEAVHPAAGKVVDFFGGVWKRWQLNRQRQQQLEEIESMAKMTAAQVADEIRDQLKASIPDNPALRSEVEIYLSLAPAAMRASLKRPADPTGRSVPAEFSLRTANDVIDLFPASVPQFRPGDSLPGLSSWVLVEVLGAGGFGEVWLAAKTFDDTQRAAVKFCTDPTAKLPLIEHELKQVVRLMKAGGHANLVPLHEYNLTGDRPWLMYEYVSGGTLADAIIEWQALAAELRVAKAVAALLELTAAAGHLHRLSPPLVHRDLKPANVLRCGKSGCFRVTDLGLGGSAAEYELSLESRVGGRSITGRLPSMLGGSHTPIYASPEQRKGNPPDPRDDVHAVGVIAYQMLTGRLDGGPGVEMADELAEAGAPAALIDLIRKCVSSKAEKRPADGKELGEMLAVFGVVTAETPAPVPASPPPPPPVKQQQTLFPPSHMTRPPSAVTNALDLRVRGKWWWRPLGTAKVVWKVDVDTPAKVDLDPAREYRLEVAAGVSDAELAPLNVLAGEPNFRRLDLSGCTKLTAVGVAELAPLRLLEQLNLYGCTGLGDAALARLAGLAALTRLDLTRCTRISDDGLSHLVRLPKLEHLDLSGCEWVTDAGLAHLAKMPALKHVGLRNTQVTDAGVNRLRRANPAVTVDR